jgi:hypothetical protein
VSQSNNDEFNLFCFPRRSAFVRKLHSRLKPTGHLFRIPWVLGRDGKGKPVRFDTIMRWILLASCIPFIF